MLNINEYIHDIYYKELTYYKGYESFCFQNCIKIILTALGIETPELYINSSLSLKCNNDGGKFELLTHDDTRSLLPEYIQYIKRIYYNSANAEEIFNNNIKYIIDNNEPIIVGVDTFYLPYAINYKKNHAIHTLILCGCNFEQEEVYIVDWYEPRFFKGKVKMKDFLLARNSENPYDGTIYSGTPIRNNWAKVFRFEPCKDIMKLLSQTIDLSINQYYSNDMDEVVGIGALKTTLKQIENFDNEVEYVNTYNQLYNGIKRHKLFLQYLEICYFHEKNSTLESCINLLNIILEKWDIILMLLLKQSKIFTERTKNRVIARILEVLEYEEELEICVKKIQKVN